MSSRGAGAVIGGAIERARAAGYVDELTVIIAPGSGGSERRDAPVLVMVSPRWPGMTIAVVPSGPVPRNRLRTVVHVQPHITGLSRSLHLGSDLRGNDLVRNFRATSSTRL